MSPGGSRQDEGLGERTLDRGVTEGGGKARVQVGARPRRRGAGHKRPVHVRGQHHLRRHTATQNYQRLLRSSLSDRPGLKPAA